jgi:hypothetical protein
MAYCMYKRLYSKGQLVSKSSLFYPCVHYQIFMNIRSYILHCSENPIYVFPEKDLRCLIPNFHIHVSVQCIYSQDQSTYSPAAEIEN